MKLIALVLLAVSMSVAAEDDPFANAEIVEEPTLQEMVAETCDGVALTGMGVIMGINEGMSYEELEKGILTAVMNLNISMDERRSVYQLQKLILNQLWASKEVAPQITTKAQRDTFMAGVRDGCETSMMRTMLEN